MTERMYLSSTLRSQIDILIVFIIKRNEPLALIALRSIATSAGHHRRKTHNDLTRGSAASNARRSFKLIGFPFPFPGPAMPNETLRPVPMDPIFALAESDGDGDEVSLCVGAPLPTGRSVPIPNPRAESTDSRQVASCTATAREADRET